MANGLGAPTGLRPGAWLLGRGWWTLPLLLSVSLALPRTFGPHWLADTPYYQAISAQMAREGTWWSPMQGGLHYFNKPPLDFWVHGLCARAFGDADWAAHAPDAAWYVLGCLLVGWLARRLHGPMLGVLAGCAMALTSDWVWRVSNFRLEFLHTLLLLSAVACWVEAFVEWGRSGEGIERDKRGSAVRWCVLAGVCIGGALMTKPLIGLGLPVLGVAWLWASGLLTRRAAVLVGLSGLIGAAVAAPWHVSMFAMYGREFSGAYFFEQSLQRATGERFMVQPWWWYFKHAVEGDPEAAPPWMMWPVYALAVAGLGVVMWKRACPIGGLSRERRAGDALAAVWTLTWLAALSVFASKRNYYVLVVHPGTAWLGAIAVGAVIGFAGRARPAVEAWLRAAAVGGLAAGVIIAVLGVREAVRAGGGAGPAEREQLMAFLREHSARQIYNADLPYQTAALAYIKAGIWPRSLRERTPVARDEIPVGALMVFGGNPGRRRKFAANLGPDDLVRFRSTPDGQFMVAEKR